MKGDIQYCRLHSKQCIIYKKKSPRVNSITQDLSGKSLKRGTIGTAESILNLNILAT
jgi:hypothetical protein